MKSYVEQQLFHVVYVTIKYRYRIKINESDSLRKTKIVCVDKNMNIRHNMLDLCFRKYTNQREKLFIV